MQQSTTGSCHLSRTKAEVMTMQCTNCSQSSQSADC